MNQPSLLLDRPVFHTPYRLSPDDETGSSAAFRITV